MASMLLPWEPGEDETSVEVFIYMYIVSSHVCHDSRVISLPVCLKYITAILCCDDNSREQHWHMLLYQPHFPPFSMIIIIMSYIQLHHSRRACHWATNNLLWKGHYPMGIMVCVSYTMCMCWGSVAGCICVVDSQIVVWSQQTCYQHSPSIFP